MDSRSRHLPALGSTAPSTLDSHGHRHCPGARLTLATHVGLSIPPPTISLTRILQFSFIPAAPAQKPCIRLPQISAFSGFFLYLERSGSVFVCLLALTTFSVFSSYFPHRFLFPSFLLPSLLCAHCKCGTWEYGRHNAGSFIPSCKHVHNGLDMET